nr:discoidin, CUB and LCCL domain-containing protein 2 isoform X3 [Equus caballus]
MGGSRQARKKNVLGKRGAGRRLCVGKEPWRSRRERQAVGWAVRRAGHVAQGLGAAAEKGRRWGGPCAGRVTSLRALEQPQRKAGGGVGRALGGSRRSGPWTRWRVGAFPPRVWTLRSRAVVVWAVRWAGHVAQGLGERGGLELSLRVCGRCAAEQWWCGPCAGRVTSLRALENVEGWSFPSACVDAAQQSSGLTDLITCLDTAASFSEPEFSKYCPAGCLLPFAEISGTIPHGYRDSSPLCMAGVHAGVVSNVLGGQISVVISKGIPYYESSLANNVTSVVGHLSTSLFTFKTSGCYGTLGMESGVIADAQITASSVLEWTDHTGQENSWKPAKARLKKPGPPWAALATDEYQWLQVDLNKEKKITGIVTTGSTMVEHNYYVSAYRVLYSDDGQRWTVYREPGVEQDKIFQGNKDYHQDVRNNFLPPIIARFIRVNPTQWQQKIAMKMELLGCQFIPKGRPPKFTQPPPPWNSNDLKSTTAPPKVAKGRAPKFTQPLQPRSSHEFPAQTEQTTATPDIRNTTVTPHGTKDVALAAVLVPVLVMVLTTLILILVCAWHWRNRKKKTEGTYGLPSWDRAGWWKGMKQFLPAKALEPEETPVHYSSSEVAHLSPREVPTALQADSAGCGCRPQRHDPCVDRSCPVVCVLRYPQSMRSRLWEGLWVPFIRGPPLNQKNGRKQATQTSILTMPRCRKFIMPTQNRFQSRGLSMPPPSLWICRGTPQLRSPCPPRPLSKLRGTRLPPEWGRTTLFSAGLTAAPQPGPSMTPQRPGRRVRVPQTSWCTRCHRARRRGQEQGGVAKAMFLKKSFEHDAAFYKALF